MERKIQDCRLGNASTEHILPFFWQRGEDHALLLEELDAIQNCGVQEFCVESRTHEQFGEEKWWEDFGFLLREAKARGMRVWLLDDKRFPSGYANNYIESHPELRITHLQVNYIDFIGPRTDSALIPAALRDDESFVGIVAYRRTEKGRIVTGEGIDLMPKLENGLIWWDIPEGVWRVYYLIRTHEPFMERKKNYISMLSAESCKAMIHAVYEPHYEHFAEYFGNTFLGFFSDEPSFSNAAGNYDSILGKENMLIPWDDALPQEIAAQTGHTEAEIRLLLPALWHEITGRTSILREGYMEAVTHRYSKNFCWMLGDWCRAHGVKYIGHVIEDMNTHQRLGYGAGHFFRALDGQDMAGIDIVLNQIIPGFTELEHTASVCGVTVDPEFFQYTLPKLGSSHAHIQALKKNRAMCEIYGAFGWTEGVPMMKYLTDIMLVSGINYFVPHAFSAKYPDTDCPPHFYARGHNTQYPLFGHLMGYTARMCHALSGGIHQACAAVYYNAEAEWSAGRYMLQQKVCKVLTRAQLDFDLVPQDTVCAATAQNGKLAINEETYGALIVPYSQYLPEAVLDAFERLAAQGVPVLFIDTFPDFTSEQRPILNKLNHCRTTPLYSLPETLEALGLREVSLHTSAPSVRYYHIRRGNYDIYQFWNEAIFQEIDTFVTLPLHGKAVFYDAWKNRTYAAQTNGDSVRLRLAPSDSIVLCLGDWDEELPAFDYRDDALTPLDLTWTVSKRNELEDEFTFFTTGAPENLARKLPDFGGILRYEAVWNVADPSAVHTLDLGTVGEAAELWVNGEYCGSVVSAPYRFDLSDKLVSGENTLRIEVYANLGYRERDYLSHYLPLPPLGLPEQPKWC